MSLRQVVKLKGKDSSGIFDLPTDNRVASDPNAGKDRLTTTDASSGRDDSYTNPINKTIDEILDERDKRINMYGKKAHKECASCE